MRERIKYLLFLLAKVDYFDPNEDIYDVRKQLNLIISRTSEDYSLVLSYIKELYDLLLKQYGFCFKRSELNDVILYINKFQRLEKIKLLKNIK